MSTYSTNPKTNIDIQDVDEFVSLSEQVWRNVSLARQWILCSEWVPSEWESKQLI